MNFYVLAADDQNPFNWLIKRWVRPGGELKLVPLPPYRDVVCSVCGQITYDDAFELGFAKARKVRGRGDFIPSDDSFRCVRQNVVDFFHREGVPGIRFSRIADTEWHVANVTRRVRLSSEAFQIIGTACSGCGRNTEVLGSVIHLGQLLEKPPPGTVFTTVESNERFDRDIIVDEKILNLLQAANITGAVATQLLPAVEYKRLSEAWQRGEDVKLPQVFL